MAQIMVCIKTFKIFELEEIKYGNLCFVSMDNMRFFINVFFFLLKNYIFFIVYSAMKTPNNSITQNYVLN